VANPGVSEYQFGHRPVFIHIGQRPDFMLVFCGSRVVVFCLAGVWRDLSAFSSTDRPEVFSKFKLVQSLLFGIVTFVREVPFTFSELELWLYPLPL
jgi:hypothetical protein